MAGIKAIFVGIVCFFIFSFIGAGVLNLGAWIIPVALILGVVAGFGDLAQSREKAVKRIQREELIREQRIEREEVIRERIRRQMRDEQ